MITPVFYMLSMIYVSSFVCTRVHLYIIVVCTDGMTIGMSLYLLLAAFSMVCYWLTVHQLWCVCRYYIIIIFVSLSGVLLYHYRMHHNLIPGNTVKGDRESVIFVEVSHSQAIPMMQSNLCPEFG